MLTDPLTGVYSRATLQQRLNEEIERAHRYDIPLSLILLDLDHYKSVNDAFGHARGDKVLTEFAERIGTLIRRSDLIYRYGGDEFLLLLPNTTKGQAIQLAQRLLDGVRSQPFRGKPPLFLSISLGVSSYPDDAHTPEALFDKADLRHYDAKRHGRGRVVAEDTEKPPILPFDEEARLVEREDALAAIQRFLHELPEKRRGLLAITGVDGSGRSRLLNEASKVARLQGYEVVGLRGNPALKNRTYGDIGEVYKNWEILPAPTVGPQAFGDALQRLVEEKGRSGLLFSVDNLHEVDWATLELLRDLLLTDRLPMLIGMAYTVKHGLTRLTFPLTTPYSEIVELGPLSRDGFHIWLRMILKWEAPVEFADWLYQQTGGLPTLIQRGLMELIDRGIMERGDEGWTFSRAIHTISLKEKLGLPDTPPPNNLPASPTGFVGREQEIKEAKKMVDQGRLLSIIGPGGAGKTRLALQVVCELLEYFKDGAFWVPLASVDSTDRLVSSICNAIRFSSFSRGDPELQLMNFLREKEMLLVFDNFEHLTSGADLVGRILENAPHVKLLITSRERLNLQGEGLLELRGMDYPKGEASEQIEQYDAVQLFVQSARRSYSGFVLDSESRQAVSRICQIVEGLPLGVELAAGWVRILPCTEIVQEIEQNLDFLSTQARDVPERHRSLRAVFEHSWNLLLGEEREALMRVSIFEGGFKRDAALAVAAASVIHLSMLRDKTLLRKLPSGRYEMHEVLRQYAGEKLRSFPDIHLQTLHNHCVYYAQLLENHRVNLRGEHQKEALEEINEEIENVRAAWGRALEHGWLDQVEKSVESLHAYYEIRSLFQEGEQTFQEAAASLEALAGLDESQERRRKTLVAALIARHGTFSYRLGKYEIARQLLEKSLNQARSLDDQLEIAFILQRLSTVQVELGEFEAARKNASESLTTYRRNDEKRGIGLAVNQLGTIYYQQGEFQRAEQCHKESLRLFRDLHDRFGLANTLNNLGNVESELGDYYQAKQYYQEGLAMYEEIGGQSGMAVTLNNLGDICREMGELPEARQYLHNSLEISTQIGDRFGMAIAFGNLGVVEYLMGNYDDARAALRRGLEICQATRNNFLTTYLLAFLANVACAEGELSQAKGYLLEALKLWKENKALLFLMEILLGFARLLSKIDRKIYALELAVFVKNHPAAMKSQREAADLIAQELGMEFSTEFVAQIQDTASLRPLDEVLNKILQESSNLYVDPPPESL